MMKKIPLYIIVISFLLLAAIAWHTLAFDHDHPRELFGDGIQAVLHGEDRKWIILGICILFLLAFGTAYAGFMRGGFRHMPNQGQCFGAYETAMDRAVADPMKCALYNGIMHPKLCD